MSASLFGERFVGMREPAWHKLGTVLTDQVTAGEAILIGGLNYDYEAVPVGYTLPDGTFLETDNRRMILRAPVEDDPVWQPLGIVSNSYHFLQNRELAAVLDKLTESTGWKFETVGALGRGETVFITLKAEDRSVKGDRYEQYFIVSDGKVSGRALQISVAPVRVVCMNTLLASDAAATVQVKIPHGQAVLDDYSFWVNAVALLQRRRDSVFNDLEKMASKKIDEVGAQKIISSAFPYPRMNDRAKVAQSMEAANDVELMNSLQPGVDAWNSEVAWVEKHRVAAHELLERFNTGNEQGGQMSKTAFKAVQGTAYAALQAVTELCDWAGRGSDYSSQLFGYRAKIKQRAYEAALILSN